ncbi:MAG: cold shock domain-containing protein [Bacteroidetes bacterium]|nr:MAG: cold shock domain-containing protein [Bacteroidota bacterium]
MADTYNKKEREKKKALRRKEKSLKREAKKDTETSGSLDSMMAYVDENGIIRDTPPDQSQRKAVKAEDIELGVPKQEKEEIDPILEGMINYFDSSKGYGFIKHADENIFVHHSNISGDPSMGKKVKFEKEKGPKGWVAVRVKVQ